MLVQDFPNPRGHANGVATAGDAVTQTLIVQTMRTLGRVPPVLKMRRRSPVPRPAAPDDLHAHTHSSDRSCIPRNPAVTPTRPLLGKWGTLIQRNQTAAITNIRHSRRGQPARPKRLLPAESSRQRTCAFIAGAPVTGRLVSYAGQAQRGLNRTLGIAHNQPPVDAAPDDCFARRDVAELTIELATFQWSPPGRTSGPRDGRGSRRRCGADCGSCGEIQQR
jgi:hypothetical protein